MRCPEYQRLTQHRLSEVDDGEDHKLMDDMDNLQWLINAGKELEKLEKITHLGFYSREDPAPEEGMNNEGRNERKISS